MNQQIENLKKLATVPCAFPVVRCDVDGKARAVVQLCPHCSRPMGQWQTCPYVVKSRDAFGSDGPA